MDHKEAPAEPRTRNTYVTPAGNVCCTECELLIEDCACGGNA